MNIEQERAAFERSLRIGGCKAFERYEEDYRNPVINATWLGWKLRALRSQDREDAERYRWLRDIAAVDPAHDLGVKGFASLDAYIDHARRIEGGGE